MRKYILIPANYRTFDFERLFGDVYSANGNVVHWGRNINDPHVSKGDICYIYYSNLPDHTSRIILKGTVGKTEIEDIDSISKKKVESFEIKDIETVNWKNDDPKFDFSGQSLKEHYGINIRQNKRYLKRERENDLSLINDLKAYSSKHKGELKLDKLKDEMMNRMKCCIDGKHKTFRARNSLLYFETHHLIQQHICRRKEYKGDKKFINSVYDKRNLIYLCPNCHRKIHYGRIDEIRNMIKQLYDNQQEFYDSHFKNYAAPKCVLDWLYDMYDVSEVD